MKSWRTHRFMPLAELVGTAAWRQGVPLHLSPRVHASLADGFQQGVERGYREGHESGLREGRAEGATLGIEEGRREGVDAGRREVRAHFDTLAAPIDSLFSNLERLQADYQTALRREVVDLVAKVARQVIRCELALQPAQLLALVDETLATMPVAPDSVIEVYLNEADLQRIQEIDHSRAARWNLLADARLEPGECRVRSGSHEADAGCRQRLGACMEQITAQLLPEEGEAGVAAAPMENAA
ncbi:MAG TPA: flagellar assembly protein FliH [Povalibacter sp.]|uniref:flagellar assembly protein FliH n=1 Tax=Povalibacter sp. TaxID=1962978 RepID=UPI002BDF4E0B|nr:flagellar assembly protein FliH [Povalibacter sp.]HMN43154.1 flagellar assembly protein FliH [Povalibacter sp.]